MRIKELRVQLQALEATETDVNVKANIGRALAELKVFEAEVERLDREDVTIDVDMKRGILERMASFTRQADLLGKASETAADTTKSLGSRLMDTAVSAGPFTTQLRTAAVAVPVLITAVVSLVAYVAALAASLAQAVAGLGALAVAAGSLLLPAIALGIGAFQRFQAQADKAGTAAHALKGALGEAGQAFQKMIAPGADAVFRGMAAGLRALTPTIKALSPAFTAFGRAVGGAFKTLGREFASPAWQRFFSFLGRAAAQVTPLLTRSFIAFARILRDIATAAMPFLIAGLRALARALEGIADGTKNIDLSGVMSQLSSWLNLAKQVGRVFLGFIEAAAPAGKGLVDTLAEERRPWPIG